ncbi:MAG: D-aminoacylase, partial [Bacteroidota bacterium]
MKSANSVFLCILLLILGASAPQTKPYDLIIRGGRIVDGSGNPWYEADVGIRNGRIATIGRLDN